MNNFARFAACAVALASITSLASVDAADPPPPAEEEPRSERVLRAERLLVEQLMRPLWARSLGTQSFSRVAIVAEERYVYQLLEPPATDPGHLEFELYLVKQQPSKVLRAEPADVEQVRIALGRIGHDDDVVRLHHPAVAEETGDEYSPAEVFLEHIELARRGFEANS